MLLFMVVERNWMTSSGRVTPSSSDFFLRIAILVSTSGGCRSAMSPHSNRDRKRSSMSGMSFGNRSLERTICLCASYKALNVWKNSSCVRSPRQELNVVDHQHVDMPVSLPQVHHLVVADGVDDLIRELLGRQIGNAQIGALGAWLAIAFNRWVFPSPTPP